MQAKVCKRCAVHWVGCYKELLPIKHKKGYTFIWQDAYWRNQPSNQTNKLNFKISCCCFRTRFWFGWKHNQTVSAAKISLGLSQLSFPLASIMTSIQIQQLHQALIWRFHRETSNSVFWDGDANQIRIDPTYWRLGWAAWAAIDITAPEQL